MTVHAALRRIELQPEPSSLSGDPREFCLLARLYVGPADGDGEESFDLTVCTPEWIAERCREDGLFDARHHVVVDVDAFDQRSLRLWLEKRVQAVSGDDWSDVGAKLGRLGYGEFEDYRP